MNRLDRRLIRLRPRATALHVSHDRTVLVLARNGFIHPDEHEGLFVDETRLLSRYDCRIDGHALLPVALSNVAQHSWLGYYIIAPPGAGHGRGNIFSPAKPAQQTIEVRISRFVGEGMHEDLDLTNFTQRAVSVQLALTIDADFADQQEIPKSSKQHGQRTCEWVESRRELTFDYRAEHSYVNQSERGVASLHRGLTLRVTNADSPPEFHDGRIVFTVNLAPHGHWHTCLQWLPFIDGQSLQPCYGCHCFEASSALFLEEATDFSTLAGHTLQHTVIETLQQGKRDLAALRFHHHDSNERNWTVAAGIPLYVSLFGRDTLTTGWEAALLGPELMRGALTALARTQGTEENDWRDEQPGRMLHEAHRGPQATLNFNPKGRDYCSVTTSNFYPFVLAQLWHWTGRKEEVAPYIEPAMRALQWLKAADLDQDGFVEYQTRSTQGARNQSWKDSNDAMVYEDGSQVPTPIATCEEQGILYAAKLNMAEVLWWFDRKDEATQLHHEAIELKQRFNEAYWVPELDCFAMALDPDKRPVRSIASNPIHCVVTGIAERELALRTLDRMFAADMFSGWGIRTLSAQHPAYDPYSYHRGSVWPVEHGPFAVALYRYGQHERVHQLCQAQFELASLFDFCRLPECVSGHPRDEAHPFPALYPDANSPQAWSASTPLTLVQVLLGLQPFAPLNMLFIDPQLPEWLPQFTLHRLRVADAIISIRFFRTASGRSDYEICEQRGTLHVIRQPSPWSLTATVPERLRDLLEGFLPGK
ncbi:MAG: amylo-alpha-1,6-glucosidase [Proteobacteria bacterium]|nr:amylo-alpha-1,6-glucosidase [Pseudomonadota bacterium]